CDACGIRVGTWAVGKFVTSRVIGPAATTLHCSPTLPPVPVHALVWRACHRPPVWYPASGNNGHELFVQLAVRRRGASGPE
ncbi:MAG: hypothetical protein ACK5DR_21770, partial [Planctomyces sp.]